MTSLELKPFASMKSGWVGAHSATFLSSGVICKWLFGGKRSLNSSLTAHLADSPNQVSSSSVWNDWTRSWGEIINLSISLGRKFTQSLIIKFTDSGIFCVTIKFSCAKLDFRGNVQTGENNSVEITRLARKETRHDFLAHGGPLLVSLYGRQGGDSVLVPQ